MYRSSSIHVLVAIGALVVASGAVGCSSAAAPGGPEPVAQEQADLVLFDPCDAATSSELTAFVNATASNYAAEPIAGLGGYAIVASRRVNGILCVRRAAGGDARTAVDGYAPFTPDTISGVGSVSKVITAEVVLDALVARGLCGPLQPCTTTPIGPFLPPTWSQGLGVSQITFEQLLTMTSGMPEGGDQSLEQWVAQGCVNALVNGVPVCSETGQWRYNNYGYNLLMLLAQGILSPGVAAWFPAPDAALPPGGLLEIAGKAHEAYVATHYFAPLGSGSAIGAQGAIDVGAGCHFDASSFAWAYPMQPGVVTHGSTPSADEYSGCGAGTWNMSTLGLNLFLDRLHWHAIGTGNSLEGVQIPQATDATTGQAVNAIHYGYDPGTGTIVKGGFLPVGNGFFQSMAAIFPKNTLVSVNVNSLRSPVIGRLGGPVDVVANYSLYTPVFQAWNSTHP